MAIIHVISVSSGKDSDATLSIALNRCPTGSVVPIFCDTGNEHDYVYEHLDYLERMHGIQIVRLKANFAEQFPRKRSFIARDQRMRREYDTAAVFDKDGNPVWQRDARGIVVTKAVIRNGIKLHEPVQKQRKVGGGRRVRWTNKAKRRALSALHPSGNPFLDLCMLKGRFPSRCAQFCTEKLKRDIAVGFQLDLIEQGHSVISWQGVRRDESDNRRHAKQAERLAPKLWIFRPLVDASAADVFRYLDLQGMKPNPLYYLNMKRVGCMYCHNASKDEIREVAIRFPEHPRRLARWEEIVSQCSKRGYSSFFHKTDDNKGTPAAIFSRSKIEKVIEWANTSHGGRQLTMFSQFIEPTVCASAYGLCE